MNDSIFDSRRDVDPHDDRLIADLQLRLAPLRFELRPLDLDRLVRDENDDARDAHIAEAKPGIARRVFLVPAARWSVAASLLIVAALSLWSVRERRSAMTAATQAPHIVTSSPNARAIARHETHEATNRSSRDEEAQRGVAVAATAPPIALVRHADAPSRRAARASRIAHAKRADRDTQPRRGRATAPPDPSAATTEDLLLAIRVTGDTLDRTSRHLAARFAAASFVPESKFLRSLNPTQVVIEETRP